MFILCHSVKWIPNIWELQQSGLDEEDLDWPVWIEYVTYTSHLLTTINCSTNVFIYFIKHKDTMAETCCSPCLLPTEMVAFDQQEYIIRFK